MPGLVEIARACWSWACALLGQTSKTESSDYLRVYNARMNIPIQLASSLVHKTNVEKALGDGLLLLTLAQAGHTHDCPHAAFIRTKCLV